MFIEIWLLMLISLGVCIYVYAVHRDFESLKKRYERLEHEFEKFVEHINEQKFLLDEHRESFVKKMNGLDQFELKMPPDEETYERLCIAAVERMNACGFDTIRLRYYKFRDVRAGHF